MTSGTPKPQIDTSKPHSARVYDYYLGGKDNYPVDRELAEKLAKGAQRGAQINREFMHRAVAWAARSGIDQFLDIGTGIPTEPNLHQIVQKIVPAARIVYADNDPIVLRHAEALLVSTPEGATGYLHTDVRQPREVLEHAGGSLDFGRPVALSLVAVLHFLGDDDDPYGVTRTLVDALPSGSLLIISHGTADFLDPEQAKKITGTYRSGGITLRPRTRAEVERFFDGLDLVEPGLVRAPEWYKDTPAPANEESGFYVGAARVR
ncbi:SAM-dependent methyltransferase [Streptomyces sp. NBC_01716]|uniref:SAM-dependent methyltransferase n=1 Tax=Streptomyces sp. NBC_01716 TaxID=2975917 RepID=UPI002E35AFA7|nr:SAM-dependent methyltransferase [Streptomyces sp. NBC_01716]